MLRCSACSGEELGDVFRQVHLAIGPAGHAQFGQGVGAHVGETQWLQQSREGLATPRQLAVRTPVDGADGAVVEHDLATVFDLFLHVAATVGDRFHQLVEQTEIQRFGQPDAVQCVLVAGEVMQGCRHFDVFFAPCHPSKDDMGQDSGDGDERL